MHELGAWLHNDFTAPVGIGLFLLLWGLHAYQIRNLERELAKSSVLTQKILALEGEVSRLSARDRMLDHQVFALVWTLVKGDKETYKRYEENLRRARDPDRSLAP